MNQILILGTEPACPRCQLLLNAVESIVDSIELDAEVLHTAYTSEMAKEIAKSYGLVPGTAKQVAEATDIFMDHQEISEIIRNADLNINSEYAIYNDCNWSEELDIRLRPYEEKAVEAGIMMTPVLAINGIVKHQGSIPPLARLEGWLTELKGEEDEKI